MAAYILDDAFDAALNYIKNNTTALYICNAQPTTYTQASSTYKLGTKATPTVGSPTDGDASGRKVVVSAITDGTVDSSGTASHFALTSGGTLLVAQALNATQVVTSGNTFTLTAYNITIPDPTA